MKPSGWTQATFNGGPADGLTLRLPQGSWPRDLWGGSGHGGGYVATIDAPAGFSLVEDPGGQWPSFAFEDGRSADGMVTYEWVAYGARVTGDELKRA